MAKANFTVRAIEAVKPGRKLLFDTGVRGLGLLVTAKGTKTFFWQRRCNGKLEWHTLGNVEEVTIEAARTRASEINAAVARWKEGGCIGPAPVKPETNGLTVGKMLEDYFVFHVMAHAKNPGKAMARDKWLFDRHLSSLRERKVDSLTRGELRELHAKNGQEFGAVSANRAIELLRRVINWGIDAEHYDGANVAARVKLFPEFSRPRVAEKTELARLFAELEKESIDLKHFVWLALLTGARKSDILSMTWEALGHLPDRRWNVPESTKEGRPYVIPLSPRAVAILAERRKLANGSPFVFSGHGVSGHLIDLKRGWSRLLKRAGIKNLTQHDLRRTAASAMLKSGANIVTVGKTLGHAAGSSATAIYARAGTEDMIDAVNATEKALLTLAVVKSKKLLPKARA
jgi:integrase